MTRVQVRWKDRGEKWSDWSIPFNTYAFDEEFDSTSFLKKITEHFSDGSKSETRRAKD